MASKVAWIGFVAGRYVARGRKKSPAALFSVLGIATGVLALTVILSVMNGFQLSFIESILEMSSCHLRIDHFPQGEAGAELERRILALPGVTSAMPFREISGLLRTRSSNPRGVVARGVPQDALERDPGLRDRLVMEEGAFDLSSPDSIIVGAELARYLGLRLGDKVHFLSITGNLGGNINFEEEEEGPPPLVVRGMFRCGFYEYDLGWAYINLDRAAAFEGEGRLPVLGVKLKNRWQDGQVLGEINRLLAALPPEGGEKPQVSSWRDYNRAFFGALRTEKLMMFFLLGLIFVVAALNIYQSQRRAVLERREEIGLLRALGASDLGVRLIFAWDGFITGLAGAALGLSLGLLAAFHIPQLFSALEGLVNGVIRLLNAAAGLFGEAGEAGDFSVFSPQIFYIKEIPSRVIPQEVILISMFGLLSALLASWFASGKVSRTRPAEVLRYE